MRAAQSSCFPFELLAKRILIAAMEILGPNPILEQMENTDKAAFPKHCSETLFPIPYLSPFLETDCLDIQ